MAALITVWGTVKHLHPWLAYRVDLDWDRAFVEAVPAVYASRTAAEFAAAAQAMLARLHDPVTRVLRNDPPGSDDVAATIELTSDSILVVRPSTAVPAGRADTWQELLPRSRAVVLDLRRSTAESSTSVRQVARSILRAVVADTVFYPSHRWRLHVGYMPDRSSVRDDGDQGMYHRGVFTSDGVAVPPTPGAVKRPIVLVVDARTEIPQLALALQEAGRAAIVAEGSAGDEGMVRTQTLSFSDGLRVQVRKSEIVRDDGIAGVPTNLIVAETGSAKAALDSALALARDFAPAAAAGKRVPARVPQRMEAAYPGMRAPSLPYRLLAVARTASVIKWFHPQWIHKQGEWDSLVPGFIAVMEKAVDSVAYGRAARAMAAAIRDGHTSAAFAPWPTDEPRRPPFARIPVGVQLIDSQLVVTRIYHDSAAHAAGLELGTIIRRIDGEDAIARMNRYRGKFSSASTPQGEDVMAAFHALRGNEGTDLPLDVVDARGRERQARMPHSRHFVPAPRDPARIRWLRPGVGYVNLRVVTPAEADSVVATFANANALVLDLRGTVGRDGASWALLRRLARNPDAIAMTVEVPVVALPLFHGTHRYFSQPAPALFDIRAFARGPGAFTGRTAVLVDENIMSAVETLAMEWKAATGAFIVGSPTAGADSDVTSFVLPGGIVVQFTGSDRKTPDGRSVTGFGLQPDILARPTIAGLRAGRDEVLEAAVERLVTQER